MKKSLAIVSAALAAVSAFALPRKAAEITVSGYTGASTLENFPVLVRISPARISGFSYADCAAGGADISFVAADGETILPHEIDTWDTAGESLVWVRVPSVSGTATTFAFRWADTNPPSVTSSDVWSAGYAGVWHLNETGAGGTSANSTANGSVLDGENTPATVGVTGKVGGGRQISDLADTKSNVGGVYVDGSQNCTKFNGVFTISGWFWHRNQAYYYDHLFYKREAANSTTGGIAIEMNSGNNQISVRGGNNTSANVNTTTFKNTWSYLIFVYNGTKAFVYQDGVLKTSASGITIGKAGDNNLRWVFGNDTDGYGGVGGDISWKGVIDEVRLRAGVTSADWAKAEYATMASDSFLSYGAAESLVSDGMLRILGAPAEIGSPTPAYGSVRNLAANDPIALSMAATVVAGEGTVTNYLKGWKLEAVNADTGARTLLRFSSDAGETVDHCAYVHASYAEFTWLWDVRDVLGVGAPSLVANGGNSLTLSAAVAGIGYTAPSATLKFVYGISPDALTYTNVASASVTEIGDVQATLTRLTPGAVYYVKAVLETNGAARNTTESAVVAFQTAEPGAIVYYTAPCIVGAGASYIDTGYNPTPTTRTVIDFQFTESVNQYRVFGLESGNLFYSIYRNGSGNWAYTCQNDSGSWTQVSPAKATDLNRHLFDFNFANAAGARCFTIDGGATSSATGLVGTRTKTASYSLFLGAARSSASAASNISKHRIYSCQMYDDDVIVRDFIPVVSDGVAGLYDLVEGVFHPSASATAYQAPTTATPHEAHVTPLSASEVPGVNTLAGVELSFPASSAAQTLRVAYGPADAGADPADWAFTETVATIDAGATDYTYGAIPATWGSDSNLVMRFYFDGLLPRWSNPIFWHDYSAPSVTDVAADGTGGDTLVVSGTLAAFPGSDCTLTVYTGDSPTTVDNAWPGLAGAVRTATGDFSLTLFEPDTAAARYLAPGSTLYVSVGATANGLFTRTAPVEVTLKAAPAFASSSASVARRTVTFTAALSDLGMADAATVTLYVGPSSAAEGDLVAAESAAVADKASFTLRHVFDDFETTYKWQLRAVSTAAGGTASLETRTAVGSVKTLDTTTYTWKPAVSEGNWSDAANWTDNQSGDSLGYPKTAAATAIFAGGTTARVAFTEALTIAKLDCSTGPNVTFAQGGASTNATKLTAANITWHNNSSQGGTITLDGVAIASTSGDTYIDTARSLRLVNGANLHISGIFGHQARNDVLVADGSFLSCNGTYFGGGTLTISNATFWTRGDNDIVGRNTAGGHVVFQGDHPLFYHGKTDKSFYSALGTANVQLDFLVPVGGYTAAPLQGKATPSYFLGNNAGNAGSCALTVNVLDESPANFADATITTPLILWPTKGVNKNMVLQGHLPAYGAGVATDDAFAWNDPEAANPTGLNVTIVGSSHSGQLQISGTPEAFGASEAALSPAYGYTALAADATLPCAAPSSPVYLSETERVVCTGWKLYDVDAATLARTLVDSGSGPSASVTGTGLWRELEWQWRIEYRVAAAAGSGGSVSAAEQWAAIGETVTVSATPASGASFYRWTGDVPASVADTDASITFAVSGPVSLTANFGGILYVAEDGDDNNDGSSPETAFATIEKAIASVTEGGLIRVCTGEYRLTTDRVTISKALTLAGYGDDPGDVIIRPKASAAPAYIFTLSQQYARLENLTLADGRTGSANNEAGAAAPALILNSGTMANCIVRGCTGAGYWGAVQMFGGLVEDCVITNNLFTRPDNSQGNGGGVSMHGGGTLRNCLVAYNRGNRTGGGVYIRSYNNKNAALVTGCRIIGNSLYSESLSGGGVQAEGGLVEKCLISGNGGNNKTTGIGVQVSGGTVRNCVITGHSGYPVGAGAYVASGSLLNCTVHGNSSRLDSAGGSGVYQTGGTVKNVLAYGNGDGSTPGLYTSGGTAANNLVDNPFYVDAANGDYTLLAGSPAIDAGETIASVADDYAGTARPQGAAYDIGALEFTGAAGSSLAVTFTASATLFKDAGSPAFTAVVTGAEGDVAYAWDFDADGTVDSTDASPTWADVPLGLHSVSLTVTAGGESASFSAADLIDVRPATTYVATGSTPAYPYATPATAAHTLQEAVNAVWATDDDRGTVIVADGTYEVAAGSVWTRIVKNVEVKSENGPASTILHPAPGTSSNRRVLYVRHAGALVHGFTLENGNWYSYSYGDSGGGSLRVSLGTVSNCVVRKSSGSDYGGAVSLYGGLVTHCEIYGNTSYRGNNDGAACGGGVYMTGGTLAHSTVTNNVSSNGGNIYMTGGAVRDCLVADGRGKRAANPGQGIYMTGGTVERCVVRANGVRDASSSQTGGGIYMTGGTVRNCLVEGNRVSTRGAGIYQAGGLVEFCTLTGNSSSAATGSGLYLNKNTAVARNNILYGNGLGPAAEAVCNIEYVSAASFATNIVSPATSGVGNIDTDPLFADAANGDYTLGAGSPAIDAAAVVAGVTNDLAWNLRPKDGNGDGDALPDIGCYEAASPDEGPLRCAFTASESVGFDELDVVFTASVAGGNAAGGIAYDWDVGAGTITATSADGSEVTVHYATYGRHDVTLTVTAGGQTATSTVPGVVSVGTAKIHLNTTGSGVWPYATPETGTNDICEVLNSALYDPSVQLEVIVDDGDYPIREKWGVLSGNVRIHSVNGPSATAFYGKNGDKTSGTARAAFFLNNAGAVLEGVTVRDCSWDGNVSGVPNGAVRVNDGLVTNCVILRCRGGVNVGGGVDIRGGLVTDCVIDSCEGSGNSNPGIGQGGGVGLTGPGTLRNSIVTNCTAVWAGGGIYMTHARAMVTNCVVVGCYSARGNGIYYGKNDKWYTDDRRVGGGVRMSAGTLANCRVTDNYGAQGGGVYAEGGTIVNCLIARNAAYAAYQGLYAAGATKVVNCTVADNGVAPAAGLTVSASSVDATLAAATVTMANTIVWSPACVTGLAPGSASVTYSCYAAATEGANGNTAKDPLLRRREPDRYSFTAASPCRNAGSNDAFGAPASAVDLLGAPRLYGKIIDIGCFELQSGAGTVLILQ